MRTLPRPSLTGLSLSLSLQFYYLGWDMHGLAQQPDRKNTIEEHLFRALRTARLVPENTEGMCGVSRRCRINK